MVLFDPKSVDDSNLIPPGAYKLLIDKVEVLTPKSGQGRMVKAMFKVADGQRKGFTIFEYIVFTSPVGARNLKALLAAVGHRDAVSDENEMCRILSKRFIMGEVEVEPGKEGFSDRNKVWKFAPLGGASATPRAPMVEPSVDDVPF